MPTQNGTWSSVRCWYFYPGGWHDEYSIQLTGGDTLFNSHIYKKLSVQTHHAPGTLFDSVYTNFLGGMREVNKRVYFFSDYLCNDTIERLIYDFNPTNIGDTVRAQVLSNFPTFIDRIIVGIDSVQIGSLYHRRVTLADTNGIPWETWTEGVGSSLGLAYSGYYLLSDNSYDLTCFRVKDVVLYSNPAPYFSYCTPPMPHIVCDSAINAVPSIYNSLFFSVFPNPVTDFFTIDSKMKYKAIRVLNSIGEEVLFVSNRNEVDIRDLSIGLYFIQLVGIENNVISASRFIKL
ncbi:MAG: T9SS type A sorting domain-containing protein [Bacteroidetes bacterium]|nr:T9SS type A sorting domain-containing protein [Bacteroidota bacterium]